MSHFMIIILRINIFCTFYYYYFLFDLLSTYMKKKTKPGSTFKDLIAQPSGSGNIIHAAAFSPCVCATLRSHASIIAAALLIYSGRIR